MSFYGHFFQDGLIWQLHSHLYTFIHIIYDTDTAFNDSLICTILARFSVSWAKMIIQLVHDETTIQIMEIFMESFANDCKLMSPSGHISNIFLNIARKKSEGDVNANLQSS